MNTVVIYPGRFHPFHRGHKASYNELIKQFGAGNVYVVSSDLTAPLTSPFSFDDKRKMMAKLGIPSDKIVQVKNPYQAHEVTRSIPDPENTVLIFAVSEKDMTGDGSRFKFGTKKDGTPSYMQPLPDNLKQAQPMTRHSYVAVTPTVNFKVRGKDANSASEIRKEYIAGNSADRDSIIVDLYGEAYPEIRDLFDRKLGVSEQTQALIKEARSTALTESNRNRLTAILESIRAQESTVDLFEQLDTSVIQENPDYIEEKWSQRYKDSINCSNPQGFSQHAHCAGRKKKVNESSGPSLQGSFTPDLTRSKVWLLKELADIAPKVSTVYILGSWYGNLALFMHLQPTVKYTKIINVEIDSKRLNQSQRMLDHVGAKHVEYMLKDANELDYQQLGNRGVVVNTSLTSMADDQWFDRIPTGTMVVLQARDQDPGEQYNNVQDIIDRFPLNQVYYAGTLDLQDPETQYQRYMVIGQK
jgi:hypothetical protein